MRTTITAALFISLATALNLPPAAAEGASPAPQAGRRGSEIPQKLALGRLACALQTTAEVQRRGRAFGREADYVVAGLQSASARAGGLLSSRSINQGVAATNAFQADLRWRPRQRRRAADAAAV